MLAPDAPPSRLDRARTLARRLVRELAGDRIGIVAFAGRAYILSPLTVDHGALELYLDALDPEIVSHGGSSLAAALRQATDLALGHDAVGRRPAVLLVSDGEALEDERDVLEQAERAARAGIVVHTAGVGTTRGSPIPDRDPRTGALLGYKRDAQGQVVISRLGEGLLRRIAERTNGIYVHLDQAGATDQLLAALRRGPQAALRGERQYEPRPRDAWFVALALACLAADALLAAAATPRRPPALAHRTQPQQAR